MELEDLRAALDAGERITGNSPLHEVMHRTSQEALRITGELNGGYHEPARVRELLSELTGTAIDETVTLFPPLHSDFGKNLRIGRRVFINSGCRFQDQGGVSIGDDAVIGAGSLVTRDVPAGMLAMGSPARVVRPVAEQPGTLEA